MAGRDGIAFEVDRKDYRRTRTVPVSVPAELEKGQVLFAVDRFALTANNVTYAVVGDMLDYWGFFPAADGWGRIPAMGFGDVLRSAHPDVPEGDRVFGFFPMASHLVVAADRVDERGFVDASAHRGNHAPIYRQFLRTSGDPLHDPAREDLQMLVRNLFLTSFLADDFLAENDFFGASSFVVTSASSKTSIALAFLLKRRPGGRVVGLTSPRNAEFVRGLGCYDDVVLYDDVRTLPKEPSLIVDMAGNREVTRAFHEHLADDVKYHCGIGATHWERGSFGAPEDMPGARPEFFFAPTQAEKRMKELGPVAFQERIASVWDEFATFTDGWLEIVRGAGADALERAYQDAVEGSAEPCRGRVLSLRAG